MNQNQNSDTWSGYLHGGTKDHDLYKFTSIYGWLPFSKDGFTVVTQWIDENDLKILESGSGSGRVCIELALRNQAREVIGVDLSKKMLEVSRKGVDLRGLSNISFVEADIFKLPFQDNTFDVVFNKGVIEHFDNYSDIVKEMVRVTKIGGKIIVAVPNKNNLFHRLWYWYTKNISKTYPFGKENLFTHKKLKELFSENALKNLEKDGYGVFYRITKCISAKNIFAKALQATLKILGILLEYIVAWPLDRVSKHTFSRLFGWEIVIKGVKPKAY